MAYEDIVISTCKDIQLVIAFGICTLIIYWLYKFLNMFF